MAKSFMEHMLEPSYDVLERKRCKALCKITRQDGAVGWGCLIYEPKVQNPDWSEYFIITSCKLIPKENFDAEKYRVEFTKPNSKLKCFPLESIIKKNPLYDTSGLVVIFVDSECSDLNHGRFRHKHSSILEDLEPKIGVKETKPLFCYIESNRFKYILEKLVPKKDGSCLPSHAECCSTVLLEGERNTNLKAVGILNFEVNEQQLTFHPVWFKKSKVEHILGLPEKPTIQEDKDEKDVKFTLTRLAPNTNFTNVSPEYRVELWKKHLTGSSKLCQQGSTDGTQFKTTDLEYNSEYEVKLFTVNKHGESEQEVVTFKTNTGLPEKPVIPKDKYEKDVGFTLTWLAPNTSCNDVSPEYRVELWKKHLTGSSKLCQKGSTGGTQFKITDLEYNSEYEVKLFAVNIHGESEPEVVTFMTKTGLPEKPTIQKVKGEVDVNFTLTWLAPNTSCTDVSPKFRLEWKKKHLTGSSKLFQQGNIDETHFQFTNLEYNSEYEGKLFPFNKHGEGEPEVFTFKTKNDPNRQELQQISSEVRNIREKLDTQLREDTRNEDAFNPTEMIENISQLYKTREGTMNLLPWCEDLNFSFGDFYTRLKIIYKKKTRGTATDRVVTVSEIFNPHEECEEPRVVLIEGKPGMGKTTYCKKVVFDWATQKHATGNYLAKFRIVLLIKCREVQSDLWEAIDDQILPRHISDDQRKRFFDFLHHNQSKVLLVLDGLDEVSEKKLPMFSENIQGRELPKCRVVVTARHEAGVKVRKYCDTLLEVEGFTQEDVKTFIKKYFREKTNLAKQLIKRLYFDKTLREMSTNPLNTALLCLVYEDLNGVFPESRSKLYMDIVDCILRRYRAKKQLSEVEEDLVGLYESQLNHLGSIALKGLLEDNLDFDEKELEKHKGSDLPKLGFLSVQPGGSKLRATRRYGFLHKTFQEFFAALNLACQLIKKEISTDSIAVDRRYRLELSEVLLFTFGILAARCEETAENLMKSMATQLNREVRNREAGNSMTVI